MKSLAHAWVGLMALERVKKTPRGRTTKRSFMGRNFPKLYLGRTFNSYYRKQAERFVKFFDKHKDAFVQGSWFPDSVISDNLTGGHTFKLARPSTAAERKQAETFSGRPPEHLGSVGLVSSKKRLKEKVLRKQGYTLPDRCEALSHAIRDMVLIQRKEPKGSDILFNDDQITLYFLMLSHYLADAHVPPHSDARDLYTPPTVHPDMEKYWDDEIKRFYAFDRKRKVFDYDLSGAPELEVAEGEFQKSFLRDVLDVLSRRTWDPADGSILGKGNRKVYDYVKTVCFVSYLVSTDFIPEMTPAAYKKLKILEDAQYKGKLREISVQVLADAVDSIALIWLLTWDRYNKLKDEVARRTKEIKKRGGTVVKD